MTSIGTSRRNWVGARSPDLRREFYNLEHGQTYKNNNLGLPSSGYGRLPYKQKIVGSNPTRPTYRGGGAKVACKAHNLETRFDSCDRN